MDKNKSQGNLKRIKLSSVFPNPWNPNVQNENEYKAVLSGLTTYGQVAPLVVRTHPTKKNKFQLVDGEHRYRAMKEAGFESCDVFDLGFLPDSRAKKLTIVLSEARGHNDALKLGSLLRDLLGDISEDELLAGLPKDMESIQELIDLAEYDWEKNTAAYVDQGGTGQAAKDDETVKDGEEGSKKHDPQTYVFGPYYVEPEQGKIIRKLINREMEKKPAQSESVAFTNLMLRKDEE